MVVAAGRLSNYIASLGIEPNHISDKFTVTIPHNTLVSSPCRA